MAPWTHKDSERLYHVSGWGKGIFQVSPAGSLCMRPPGSDHAGIDLKRLADDMRRRGVDLPLLVRFTDVIKSRVEMQVGAFQQAIEDWKYTGRYRPVFPIKVNPQSHVIRDVMQHGRPHHVGLEAGSKPELMVVLALLEDTEAVIVCNGYKDETYIRMALLARRLGHECIIVLEKPDELKTVLKVSEELGIPPVIGVRGRLTTEGKGHWKTSTGDRAKFGLSVIEILDVLDLLRTENKLDCLQLLHFHIGSQISDVRKFRTAVREATRLYGELHRLGAGMQFLDVGGGLGVDYDGSASTDPSSVNYNVHEYAQAVIGTIHDTCAEHDVPHPHVITESGRSMVAHHSVLLVEALGTTTRRTEAPSRPAEGTKVVRQIEAAWEIWDDIGPDMLVESLHNIQALRRDAINRFSLGLLDLEERGYIERMYWAISSRILDEMGPDDADSDELAVLQHKLTDTYFCNFSVFQSAPDIWAIDQLFPIAPVHRLDEQPTRRAVLADLTCDSDGKIDCFIGRRETSPYLELHPLVEGERYVLGVFMVGAYQEILGDLHNLFGDTHAIHVAVADNKRGYQVVHLDEGDIVEEVMTYVHHDPRDLRARLRAKVDHATEDGHMSMEDGADLVKTFVRGLDDYTYLGR